MKLQEIFKKIKSPELLTWVRVTVRCNTRNCGFMDEVGGVHIDINTHKFKDGVIPDRIQTITLVHSSTPDPSDPDTNHNIFLLTFPDPTQEGAQVPCSPGKLIVNNDGGNISFLTGEI